MCLPSSCCGVFISTWLWSILLTLIFFWLQSLRIVPSEDRPTDAKNTNFGPAAPSAPGLIDTLRTGKPPISISSKVNDIHPLENRLKNWDATQRQTQLETYRRLFGAAAPIKRELELDIVKKTDFRPEILGNGAIPSPGQDILLNRETTVEWEDIYGGKFDQWCILLFKIARYTNIYDFFFCLDFDDSRPTDFHSEMEKQMGIWRVCCMYNIE